MTTPFDQATALREEVAMIAVRAYGGSHPLDEDYEIADRILALPAIANLRAERDGAVKELADADMALALCEHASMEDGGFNAVAFAQRNTLLAAQRDAAVARAKGMEEAWVLSDVALPPRETLEFYGNRFSVPVHIATPDGVCDGLYRWDFNGNGWVDSGWRDGPNVEDYDHVNEIDEDGYADLESCPIEKWHHTALYRSDPQAGVEGMK